MEEAEELEEEEEEEVAESSDKFLPYFSLYACSFVSVGRSITSLASEIACASGEVISIFLADAASLPSPLVLRVEEIVADS